MEQLGSHWMGFYEIWYLKILKKNLSRKCQFHYYLTRRTGTLHRDQYTFFVIPHSVLRRMRNVLGKSCRENQNTHFMFDNIFFKNRTVNEIMRKNTLEPDRPQMTMWCICNARWMPKAINTHSEYVTVIAFPLQQWLHECTSMSHLYIHCLPCVLYCECLLAL
jgi:hypothetical protein